MRRPRLLSGEGEVADLPREPEKRLVGAEAPVDQLLDAEEAVSSQPARADPCERRKDEIGGESDRRQQREARGEDGIPHRGTRVGLDEETNRNVESEERQRVEHEIR